KRIATKSGTMGTIIKNTHNFPASGHGRYRKNPATQSLAQNIHIGLNSKMLGTEPFSGTAKSGLDFICNQKNPVFLTKAGSFFQISFGWNNYTGFSLNRFKQETHGIFGDRSFEGLNIAIGKN